MEVLTSPLLLSLTVNTLFDHFLLQKTHIMSLRVEKIAKCTLSHFRANYFELNKPCIIHGAMNEWPIYRALKDDPLVNIKHVLVEKYGHLNVPVEKGSSYTSKDFEQVVMPLRDYILKYMVRQQNHEYYLAQHGLFDQEPRLRQEIIIPEYCYAGRGDQYNTNIWLGPKGTKTPLHKDPNHNIFCQVFGKKHVRLYSSQVPESHVYPFPADVYRNTSQVDVENVDNSKYPLFRDLQYWTCDVEGGDMLFIPKSFWHYVKSVDPSLSVNFWFR